MQNKYTSHPHRNTNRNHQTSTETVKCYTGVIYDLTEQTSKTVKNLTYSQSYQIRILTASSVALVSNVLCI
jgi:hypothetical protein